MPCPSCEESGCDECNQRGYFELIGCPKDFVGHRISSAVNLAGWASKGIMPEAGGVYDQDSWFVSVQNTLDADVTKIEEERRKRG